MWIVAPSSVCRIARASITIEPSLRINIQSADPGTTAPRNRGPANSPPEAALNTRRPRGPSPPSNRAPSAARIVNKWVKPGTAIASPLLMTTPPNCSLGPPRRLNQCCRLIDTEYGLRMQNLGLFVKPSYDLAMEPERFHFDLENCSIKRALDVLGEKWTLLILREAIYGLRRFDDFARALKCGRGILSSRLKTLVQAGILEKRSYVEPGNRHRPEYFLTDKGR